MRIVENPIRVQNYLLLSIFIIILLFCFNGCKKDEQKNNIVYTEIVTPSKPKLDQTLEVNGIVKGGKVYNIFTNEQVKIVKQFVYKGQKVTQNQKLLKCMGIKNDMPSSTSTIKATGSGVVSEIADIGSVYTITTEKPLVCITDLSKLEIEARVTESEISKTKTGLSVDIKSDVTDEILKGEISRIAYMADPENDKGTYINIYISFNNKDEILKPNFNVYLTINYSLNNNSLMLPKIAIMNENGKSFIYTIDKDNVVHKKYIETGMSTDYETQVIGVTTDAEVLKNISPMIKDGVKLDPKQLMFK
jgi:multidrug efflux pump subunit AcrA (membrane-fusion protein)